MFNKNRNFIQCNTSWKKIFSQKIFNLNSKKHYTKINPSHAKSQKKVLKLLTKLEVDLNAYFKANTVDDIFTVQRSIQSHNKSVKSCQAESIGKEERIYAHGMKEHNKSPCNQTYHRLSHYHR